MDQNPLSHSPTPAQATIPEEDATLLAIEALEARAVDLDARPLTRPAPRVQPPAPPIPVAQPAPAKIPEVKIPEVKKVIEPVIAKPVVEAPKPKKPSTPAEQIAHELASTSSFPMFQFFARSKPPRKQFVVIGIVLVLVALGVGGYFLLV